MTNEYTDSIAFSIWGVKRDSDQHCICHNVLQTRDSFKDELSIKEFLISGLCQKEQDAFFDERD